MSHSSIEHGEKALLDFYKNEQFQEALDWLQEATLPAPALHYNQGVFHYKLNNLGQARFHFEKAQKLDFSPHLVEENLSLVKKQLGYTHMEQPVGPWQSTQFFFWNQSSEVFLLISLLLLLSLLVLLRKTFWNFSKVLLLSLCFVPLLVKLVFFSSVQKAVVLDERELYSGPAQFFETLGVVPEGVMLHLGQRQKDWVFVLHPKAYRGWLQSEGIGTL